MYCYYCHAETLLREGEPQSCFNVLLPYVLVYSFNQENLARKQLTLLETRNVSTKQDPTTGSTTSKDFFLALAASSSFSKSESDVSYKFLHLLTLLCFQSVVYQPVSEYPTYLWTNLEPATEYTFSVYACNGYTMDCGKPSEVVKGTTEERTKLIFKLMKNESAQAIKVENYLKSA